MKLHIEFDDILLRKYQARGANPVFSIYWEHNGVTYPEVGWIDFGSIILSWWLVAATSLLNGSRAEEFLFMDGPYQLDVRAINDVYHISGSGSNLDWRIPRETLVRELLVATQHVSAKLRELGISDDAGLEQGSRYLEKAASERQMNLSSLSRTKLPVIR